MILFIIQKHMRHVLILCYYIFVVQKSVFIFLGILVFILSVMYIINLLYYVILHLYFLMRAIAYLKMCFISDHSAEITVR